MWLWVDANFSVLMTAVNDCTPRRVLPMRAIVCVAGVELPELSLSHGPVGSVLGFDHTPYDKRVRSRWYELLYPYPLRAYKHRYLLHAKASRLTHPTRFASSLRGYKYFEVF